MMTSDVVTVTSSVAPYMFRLRRPVSFPGSPTTAIRLGANCESVAVYSDCIVVVFKDDVVQFPMSSVEYIVYPKMSLPPKELPVAEPCLPEPNPETQIEAPPVVKRKRGRPRKTPQSKPAKKATKRG